MAARLLHEMGDLETREEISLIRGTVVNVISFSQPFTENLLPLKDCLDKYTLMLQEIEDELLV